MPTKAHITDSRKSKHHTDKPSVKVIIPGGVKSGTKSSIKQSGIKHPDTK